MAAKKRGARNGTAQVGRPRERRLKPGAFALWLSQADMAPTEVAKRLGCSRASVYNLRNGYFRPGLGLALRIEELTRGKVPASAWI